MPKLNISLIFRYKLAMKGNHMPRMHSCLIFFLRNVMMERQSHAKKAQSIFFSDET